VPLTRSKKCLNDIIREMAAICDQVSTDALEDCRSSGLEKSSKKRNEELRSSEGRHLKSGSSGATFGSSRNFDQLAAYAPRARGT
jgi:hypothetical protein